MTDLLGDIDGGEVQIDDVLVHGKDQAQHDNRLNQVLNGLAESKITLNKVKCEFSVSKVKVLGHIVSSEGIAADPDFADHLASKTKPLRELLRKKNTLVWGQLQDQAFTEIKEALTTAPILALYDPNRETKVNADASSYRIGGVVMQQQDNGDWKPISYVSRALSPVECRYSQVEKNVWHSKRSFIVRLHRGLSNSKEIVFGLHRMLGHEKSKASASRANKKSRSVRTGLQLEGFIG